MKFKRILVVFIVIILLVVSPILFYYKPSIMFNIKRIASTQQEMINEYFYIKLNDKSIIKNYNVGQDIDFDFYIEAELVVPKNEVSAIFSYYSKFEKTTIKDMNEDDFRSQMYSNIGVNKDNFDYQYDNFNSAYRKVLFGLSKVHTQRSPTVIFTKPIAGYVHVFLFIDKLGWDY